MSSYIGPITNSVIEGIINELKKKEVKDKVMNNIIDPLLHDMASKYYHYLMIIVIIVLIVIVLLVSILIISITNKNCCCKMSP